MDFANSQYYGRIRRGDRAAIRAVVEAYLPHILNAARASGLDSHTAEDITQSTFATFVEKASAFEGRAHVRTWLFGILYRKIAEARRGVGREGLSDNIDELMEKRFHPDGIWSNPVQPMTVYGAELGNLIEECLDTLPTAQRMAFVFREKEDLPTKEICKILTSRALIWECFFIAVETVFENVWKPKALENEIKLQRSDAATGQ